ncbi:MULTISPECIES: hypothetical protein [Paracoccus]|uniref:hypothetical protein n=1 Tax=Paracoccus TaxID=265 RepID=UPI000FD750F9|nr:MULTISPECIES: hypothetical protein [Paracoccus]AZY92381.1 hypothetical protein EOJ32_00865 [Paracoccus sp. Arc7-R13]TNB95545.1 hypothetical protein FHD68_13015 [Paracoccus marcusii]
MASLTGGASLSLDGVGTASADVTAKTRGWFIGSSLSVEVRQPAAAANVPGHDVVIVSGKALVPRHRATSDDPSVPDRTWKLGRNTLLSLVLVTSKGRLAYR